MRPIRRIKGNESCKKFDGDRRELLGNATNSEEEKSEICALLQSVVIKIACFATMSGAQLKGSLRTEVNEREKEYSEE
jgi:hypothetical protein